MSGESQHTPEPKDCAIRPACCSVHDAAPDLLEALEALVAEAGGCCTRLATKDQAHAAIRKATGASAASQPEGLRP